MVCSFYPLWLIWDGLFTNWTFGFVYDPRPSMTSNFFMYLSFSSLYWNPLRRNDIKPHPASNVLEINSPPPGGGGLIEDLLYVYN